MSRRKDRFPRSQQRKTKRLKPHLKFEQLESRLLLATTQWTNPLLSADVSPGGDNSVDPLDVLLIVNELNNPVYTTIQNRKLPNLPESNREPLPYFDVDCDGFVSPLDVLSVVNTINSGVKPIGWRFDTDSTSVDGGFISGRSCGPKLHEGTSYLTEISREVVIPENATNLSFRISDAFFDVFSPTGMKDAFEVALVDQNGKSLVHPFTPNRDALLNMSEVQSPAIAPGVRWVGDQVLVNVSQIPPNTTARLIARLVNNDRDTQTSVAIRDVRVETQGEAVPISSSMGSFDSRSQMTTWEDMQGFADVTGNLVLRHGRTSHVDDSGVIFSDVAIENAGGFSTPSTVRVVFKNISDPSVRLRNPDGFTSQGDPFVDFTTSIPEPIFKPNTQSTYRQLGFANPNQSQFTYEAEIYAKVNRDPAIQSSPNIEALLDRPYRYQVEANDPDLDELEYRLIMGPSGMTINKQTGLVTWEATTASLGNHSVSIQAMDPFGGASIQSYVLTAMIPPPNRPPVITSTPVSKISLNRDQIDSRVKGLYPTGTDSNYMRLQVGAIDTNYEIVETGMHPIVTEAYGPWFPNDKDSSWLWENINWQPTNVTRTFRTTFNLQEDDLDNVLISGHWMADNDGYIVLNGQPTGFETLFDSFLGNVSPFSIDKGFRSGLNTLDFVVVDVGVVAGFRVLDIAGSLFDADRSYIYSVDAKDIDGDPIAYRLVNGPVGMVVNSSNGVLRWNPTPSQVGIHTVTIEASDGRGGIATQEFVVSVLPDPTNNAPLIVSDPISYAIQGQEYSYQAVAVDPEYDELDFKLLRGPGGMTIDRDTGRVKWNVSLSESGSYEVIIQVTDRRGGVDHQSWTIEIVSGSGEIHGIKWNDLDQNGIRDINNEIGLEGWTIFLDDNDNGQLDLNERSTTTDSTGRYSFTGLPSGSYRVREILKRDWSPTYPGGQTTGDGRVYYVDWKSANVAAGKAEGIIELPGGSIVEVKFEAVLENGEQGDIFFAQTDGDGVDYWHPSQPYLGNEVTVRPPGTDILVLAGQQNQIYRVTLSEPIFEPIMSIVSLGRVSLPTHYVFDAPFSIVSQGTGYYGGGANRLRTESERVLVGEEGHGTIKFNGVFDDFSWTVPTPEEWHGFTFGIRKSEALTRGGLYQIALQNDEVFANADFGSVEAPIIDNRNPRILSITQEVADSNFDLARDFSTTNNPNGAWQYGWSGTTGSDFILSNERFIREGLDVWKAPLPSDFFGNPSVLYNSTRVPIYINSAKYEPGRVVLHPGADGENAVIRWTAPKAGILKIDSYFQGQDTTTTDVHVFHNGVNLFDGLVEGFGPAGGESFSTTISVLAGDTVDFTVGFGPNSNYFSDSTQLDVSLTLKAVPDPAKMIASVGERFQSNSIAWDPDGDNLIFDLPVKPKGMVIDPSTGNIAWFPKASNVGKNDVILQVSDGRGGVDLRSFVIDVATENSSPIVVSQPRRPATIGLPWQYQVVAQDAEGDQLEYSLISSPAGMTIDKLSGLVRWVPNSSDVPQQRVKIRVRDAQSETIHGFDLPVALTSDNDAPLILSSPSTTAVLSREYVYQLVADDANGDPLTFELVRGPSGMTLNDSSGLVRWKPTAGQIGRNDVAIRVNDGRGGVTEQVFVIDVRSQPRNSQPAIVSTPTRIAIRDVPYRYDAKAIDLDFDLLRWSLLQGPSGLSISEESGSVRWTPTANQIGEHRVEIVVTDASGGQANQVFTLLVEAENSPPIITSNPPTRAQIGRKWFYPIQAIDKNGDDLIVSVLGPTDMVVDQSAKTLSWTPSAAQIGIHEITVLVSDGRFTAQQKFDLEVTSDALNEPPVITSDPSLIVAANANYVYRVTAVDAESDPITYSLREALEGMVIDGSTGVLTWTPTASDIGLKQVSIIASDPNGGRFLQSYGLRVLPPNQAPTIVSEPRLSVTRGAMYRYVVRVQHTNQQALRFELTESPPGMTIDQRGTLQWNSSAFPEASANIGIRVSDGLGGVAEQNYVLQVNADISAPQVIVNATPQVANLGEDVIFTLEDTDNIGVVDRKLWIDGTLVPLDSAGRAYVRMTRAGNLPILALAKDAGGNEGRFEHFIQVVDPSDSDAPIAMLQSPSENESIRSITDIIGSVSDSNFAYYTLSIASLEGTFREIARGTSQVTQGLLGRLDPSLLANDSYRLRLEAFDSSGKSTLDERLISVAGDLKLGNFTLSFADLSVPVSGVPISVVRTYDTLTSGESDDFGFGWRMEFRDTNLRTNVPKTGSEEDLIFNPFFAGARVFLQLPGGKREGFTFQPKRAPGLRGSFLGIFEPSFIPDRGVTSQLTVPNTSLSVSASGDVFAYGSGQPFHPASPLFGNTYRLTTAEGVTYEIDGTSGDLRTIVDLNGNEVKFNDGEIVSSSGPKVQFERDAQGRIVSVIDPAGQKIRYTYDQSGDLTAVMDRAGNTTRYVYRSDRPHYLDKILDPLGREGIRTEYDEHGRLSRTVDASGNAMRQEYDLANSTMRVFDQLGNPTKFEYDDDGNIVTETNALGEVIRRTYDSVGNVLEEINPLGQKTIRTYDRLGNVLTEKDPLGNTTYTVYGPNGQVLSSVDPLGNATVNEYDSKGNLLRTTAPGGVETAMTYDRAGNPTSLTFGGGTMGMVYDSAGRVTERRDALANVTRYTYDTLGNQLTSTTRLTTPGGVRELVTSMEYDANNRVIRTIDPEGGVTRVEYNPAGNKVADIDALGRRTEYRYDERGLLIETIYPDATPNDLTDNPRTRTEYDAAGREIARIDELGRRTVKRYDKAGRHIETIYPDSTPNDLSDNPRTRTEFDAAGQVLAEIDERGNRTEFEYDAAGRRVLVRDALGNVTRNTLDAAGRQVAVADALNQVTRFVYDAAGRRTETLFPDGTKTVSSFSADGKPTGRTDQLGRITKYEYDQLNRLTAVVDALGQRTEYTYNEAGNLVSQKDANGNVTRYEYDGLGRRIATKLPLGQRSESKYDAVGNVTRSTDFNGDSIEYSYDSRNRLVSKTFPGGSVTKFTYSLTGQRQASVDGRGTTRWQYDERNRLVSRIDPDGQAIAYTYDAAGNRTTLTTTAGTIAYSFDVLNRMATVVDPSGGTTRYQYNPVSNLVRTELPNGTWETREYDALNRLVYLESKAPAGVISSYRYTLAATGRRDSVVEQTGRRVDYQYDALDRLTLESIIDAIVGNRSISYSYDPVGNRLARNDSAERVTSYTYDGNDRLLTETLNGVVTEYAYDANGNTLSKMSAVDRVFYDWDFENRLIAVDTDGNGVVDVTNVYDADGIRVAQKVGSDETRYLIDAVQPYQQVAMEYTPDGVLKVSYVHGLDLLSQNRHGDTGKSFYHVDGLGSARALSDALGLVTDSYIYDAFGRTIGQVGSTGNVYRFAGEQRDSTVGLDYLRARYMNPNVGRFVGSDPFEGSLRDPFSLHNYQYAHANPTNLVDPTGLFSLGELMTTVSSLAIRTNIAIANVQSFVESARAITTFVSVGLILRSLFIDNSSDKAGRFITYMTGGKPLKEISYSDSRDAKGGGSAKIGFKFATQQGDRKASVDLKFKNGQIVGFGGSGAFDAKIWDFTRFGITFAELKLGFGLGLGGKQGSNGQIGPYFGGSIALVLNFGANDNSKNPIPIKAGLSYQMPIVGGDFIQPD